MLRLFAALALAAALAACATAGPYAAAAKPGGPGYSEQRIENDRYRITYRGAPTVERASDYVVYRAAEVAVNSGNDWFIVDQRYVGRAGSAGGPRVSVGTGIGSYGRHTSVGIGTSIGIPVGGQGLADASLEARFGRGPKPADANAFDARQILQTLRPPGR